MPSSVNLTGFRLLRAQDSKSRLLTAFSFSKSTPTPFLLTFCDAKGQSFTVNKFKRMAWSLRSAADGSRLNSSSSANDSRGGTRLIRAIQTVRVMLIARLKELRKNLPIKLFFFLVGFYCATAFATVIGQTGDWDVLSAALAVALVEGIGALMYKYSLNFVDNIKNLVIIFNYWKAGLALDVEVFSSSFHAPQHMDLMFDVEAANPFLNKWSSPDQSISSVISGSIFRPGTWVANVEPG